jgi:hypothetical protein
LAVVAVLKRVPDVFGLDIGTVVDELDHGARINSGSYPTSPLTSIDSEGKSSETRGVGL